MRLLSSFLFVPGNRPERFEKAFASNADAVIIDLEDAVPPQDKELARCVVAGAVSSSRPAFIRINAIDTPWFVQDCSLLTMPGVLGAVLPKAQYVEDIHTVASYGVEKVLPLIESAIGIANCRAIANCTVVERLIFGTLDFQADLGMYCTDEELLPFKTELVLASRLANIPPPVDGVCTVLNDATLLAADSVRAKRLGFGGKLCIHPDQVPTVNRSFSPSAVDIEWAYKVIEARSRMGSAATVVDGKMVDLPLFLRAEEILRQAKKG